MMAHAEDLFRLLDDLDVEVVGATIPASSWAPSTSPEAVP